MNVSPDPPNRLLDAVLGEAQEFRAILLESTLQAVRHRQKVKQWRRGVVALVLCIGLSALMWRLYVPERPMPHRRPPIVRLVASQPLRPSALVTTRPGCISRIISRPGLVAMVETKPNSGSVNQINDDQLFALLDGHPSALVREAPGHVALIFLNPDDQTGFPMN